MKLFVPEDIERYASDHTTPRPVLFDELRERTYADVPYPQMQVGRVEGTLLKMLALMVGAKRILEVGTYTGYSALCMAEALPDDGKLITCDRSEDYTAVAREFFSKSPHGHKIEIRIGDGLDTVKALDGEPFDMAFVDADKARYPEYYDEIVGNRLRVGGLLVIDNVLWSGQVLNPEGDDAKGIAEVNRRATVDDRVDNVLLSIRDGVMLVRKL